MALRFDPYVPDPDRDERLRANAARVEYRPSTRVAQLGNRALTCPCCDFPISLTRSVGLFEPLACAFCEGVAPASSYVREGGWPRVNVIARLP